MKHIYIMSVIFRFTILRDHRILFKYVQVAVYGMKRIIPWKQYIITPSWKLDILKYFREKKLPRIVIIKILPANYWYIYDLIFIYITESRYIHLFRFCITIYLCWSSIKCTRKNQTMKLFYRCINTTRFKNLCLKHFSNLWLVNFSKNNSLSLWIERFTERKLLSTNVSLPA